MHFWCRLERGVLLVKPIFPSFHSVPGEIDRALCRAGIVDLAGVDEAGRGALCGPVTAAAVMLPSQVEIQGLNDSKKVRPECREALADTIREVAVGWAVAEADPDEIDSLDVLRATFLAMRRALALLTEKVGRVPGLVLVDGPLAIEGYPFPQKPVVRGDALSTNIAAASILAKTARDRRMRELALEFPGWELDVHKGYATPRHIELLQKRGPLPIHRRSFCRFNDPASRKSEQ